MRPRPTAKRMQGRLGNGTLVAALAAMLVAATACDLPADGDTDTANADYDMVCVDRQNNHVDDTNCATAPEDYSSDALTPAMSYGYVYVPTTSVIVIPPVGRPMPSGSYTFRAPTTVTASGNSAPVVQRVPSTGGAANVQRGGFGVKSGTSGGGTAKGGGGTAKGGTSSGS